VGVDGGGSPLVHAVVLNWNGWALTEACLDSLLASGYRALRVLVVDNASTDGSVAAFDAWQGRLTAGERPRVELLVNELNLGFAEGNNRGIARVLAEGADYVLVLNNDTVVEPDAVAHMVRAAEATGAAMVAPAVFDAADRTRVDRFGIVLTRSGSAYDRTSEDDGPLLCPSGCAALYRRDLVEALAAEPCGFFDRDFFMYAEDLDTGLRARARGYRAAFAGEAVVYHVGSASLGLGSPEAYRLRHRNTLWAVSKNYSAALLLREAPYLIAGQFAGLLNAPRRGRLGAVLRGKWEGLVGAPRVRRGAGGPRLAAGDWLDRAFARRGRGPAGP